MTSPYGSFNTGISVEDLIANGALSRDPTITGFNNHDGTLNNDLTISEFENHDNTLSNSLLNNNSENAAGSLLDDLENTSCMGTNVDNTLLNFDDIPWDDLPADNNIANTPSIPLDTPWMNTNALTGHNLGGNNVNGNNVSGNNPSGTNFSGRSVNENNLTGNTVNGNNLGGILSSGNDSTSNEFQGIMSALTNYQIPQNAIASLPPVQVQGLVGNGPSTTAPDNDSSMMKYRALQAKARSLNTVDQKTVLGMLRQQSNEELINLKANYDREQAAGAGVARGPTNKNRQSKHAHPNGMPHGSVLQPPDAYNGARVSSSTNPVRSGHSDTTSQSGYSSISRTESNGDSFSAYSSAPTSLTSGSQGPKILSQSGFNVNYGVGMNSGSQPGYNNAPRTKRSKAPASAIPNSQVSSVPAQAVYMNPPAPAPAFVQSMAPPTGGLYQPVNIFQLPPQAAIQENVDVTMTEATYVPMEDDFIPADPSDPQPIYPGYAAHFRTSAAAKAYRKSIRVPAKKLAPDVERVIRFGRRYWVRRLYDSMIDVSDISDSKSSIHRHRFQTASAKTFKDQDLEATAHHIFDVSIAVHTRGWNRPETYYKKAVRGKLVDHSEKSLELRLNKICECLKRRKATVDDAIRSGVTLALLCDNPWARGSTKESNNNGNKKRGQRLAMAKEQALRKEQEEALRQGRGQEEQEEAEQEEAEEEAEQEEDEQDVSDDGEE